MPKVIIVCGIGNTGKTSSIRETMRLCNIYVNNIADITMSAIIPHNGGITNVGFATGGDSGYIVNQNIAFFQSLPSLPDTMVFSCRSRGQSLQAIQNFCQTLGVAPIWTTRLVKLPTPAMQQQQITTTAQFIFNNI